MTLEELIQKIRKDNDIWFEQREKEIYSRSFLNNVAEIFECRGLEQAKLYVQSKLQTKDKKMAKGILKLLNYIAECPQAVGDAAVGHTIIKNLLTFRPN